MRLILRRLVRALAPIVAFAVASCSEPLGTSRSGDLGSEAGGVPPAGQAESRLNSTADPIERSRLATYRVPPTLEIAWAKKWVGPAGGQLSFKGFVIDVPAGAVSRTTMFTLRLPADPQGRERVVAEFGPHNQDFAVPVTIELPYANSTADGSEPSAIGWDDARDGWVSHGGELTEDGQRVRIRVRRFSAFGTEQITSYGGGIVVGGG